MIEKVEQLAGVLGQYNQHWLEHVAYIKAKLRLLQLMKQGTELFLLVGSYLIFYFVDCFTQILSMPLPLAR